MASAYTAAVAASSPTNWLPVDDASGTTATADAGAITGTYTGGVALGMPSPCAREASTCVRLDGVDDYITLGDVLGETGTTTYTWEILFRMWPDAVLGGSGLHILDKTMNVAGERAGPDMIVDSLGRLAVRRWQDNSTLQSINSVVTLVRGLWYHGSVTYDGATGDLSLYLDGVLVSQSLGSAVSIPAHAGAFSIGSFNDGNTFFFKGEVAHFARYSTALSGATLAAHSDACFVEPAPVTYYVDYATGSDADTGLSPAAAWQSFYHAAETANTGDTVIFVNGSNCQESVVRAFRSTDNHGTKSSPITWRAESYRGSTITFVGRQNAQKCYVARGHIHMVDLVWTTDGIGDSFDDIIVRRWYHTVNGVHIGGDWSELRGCLINGGFEPVKSSRSHGTLTENCTIEGANVGFGNYDVSLPTIRNNIFDMNSATTAQDNAIQTKGGTRNARIYNNTIIRRSGANTSSVGIYVGGGSTDLPGLYDATTAGFEGYNQVCYNNVVVSETAAGFTYGGIVVQGCTETAVFNNFVINASTAFRIVRGGVWALGPNFQCLVHNPVFQNNGAIGCGMDYRNETGGSGLGTSGSGTLTFDYNLIFNTTSQQSQANPRTGDPLLVNNNSDWRLRPGSGAFRLGTAIAARPMHPTGSGNHTGIDLDRQGRLRTVPWDIGPYEGVRVPKIRPLYRAL